MPKRLTAAGEAVITNKNVRTFSAVVIDGATNVDILSKSYSKSKEFGTTSLSISLNNANGKYGSNGAYKINYGETVKLIEGLYNSSNVLESFEKFTGTVRHMVPQTSGSGSTLEITAVGPLAKLEGLEIDKLFESASTSVENMPGVTGGGARLCESSTTTKLTQAVAIGDTHIHVESNIGFEPGKIMIGSSSQIFTVTSVSTSDVTLISISAATRGIAKSESVYQRMSQRTSTSGKAYYFDFGYWDASSTYITTDFSGTIYNFHAVANVSPTRIPMIMIRPSEKLAVYNDPEYDGFSIDYATGQLVFGRSIDVNNYDIYARFDYYPAATINYGEDVAACILLAVDGYGNAPYTTTDFTTTLLAEDGTLTDAMTYNREAMTIDGVCYAIGQVWFTKYNNIQTALTGTDFTPPAGKTVSLISQRYGRIILDSSVAVPADGNAICITNYSFRTIQATGVKIPVIDFRTQKVANRFVAIQELKKQLAPNYVVMESGDGKIWGKHMRQRVSKDYELKLMTALNYDTDTEVYTRVKLFGENAVPKNVLLDCLDKTTPYTVGGSTLVYAANYPLMWTGETIDNEWYVYTLPETVSQGGSVGQILYKDKGGCASDPVLWINGLRNSTWANQGTALDWAYLKEETKNVYLGFFFSGSVSGTVTFYRGDAVYQSYNISSLRLVWNAAKVMYEWRPADDPYITDKAAWSSDYIKSITYVNLQVNYSNSWQSYGPNKFKVSKRFVGDLSGTVRKREYTISTGAVRPAVSVLTDSGVASQGALNDKSMGFAVTSSFRGTGFTPQSGNYLYRELDFGQSVFVDYIHVYVKLGVNFILPTINDTLSGDFFFQYWDSFTSTWKNIDSTRTFMHSYQYENAPGYYETNWQQKSWVEYYRFTFGRAVYTDKIRMCNTGVGYLGGLNINYTEVEAYSTSPTNVTADFWFNQYINPPESTEISKIHDGLWSTQLQSIYLYEPVYGTNYLTFNLKKESDDTYPLIEAIDMTGGWYLPNIDQPNMRFDISNSYSVEYYNGAAWVPVCKDAENFTLGSGETKSFEKDALGDDFRPQKLAIILKKVNLFDQFGPEKYIVPIVEFSAYRNITLTAEAKLIPVGTAVTGNDVQDPDTLLTKFGDKLYKNTETNKYLNTSTLLGAMAKQQLDEMCKNVTSVSVPVLCRPDAQLGDTVLVSDTVNGASNTLYFVDSISSNNGKLDFRLARYWTVKQ